MNSMYYIKFNNGSVSDWYFFRKDAVTALLLLDYIVDGNNAQALLDPTDVAVIIKVKDWDLAG